MMILWTGVFFSLLQALDSGSIVGLVKVTEPLGPAAPAVIVALPAQYAEVWSRETQRRLDDFWEDHKPEFARNKEQFTHFNHIAEKEALALVIEIMRREAPATAKRVVKELAPDGKFEFRDLPLGTYRLIVSPRSRENDLIWSSVVELHDNVPVFVQLPPPTS
jgi:hypothetical protein